MRRLWPVVLLMFLLVSCGGEEGPGARGPSRVRTTNISRERVPDEIATFGSISFTEKIAVSSQVEGRVRRLYKRIGERVAAGEVLAEMERLPLEIEQRKVAAEILQAEAASRLSAVKLEEARRRVDNTLLSIDKARNTLEARQISLGNMHRKLSNQQVLLASGGVTIDLVENLRTEERQLSIEVRQAQKDVEMLCRGYRDEDILASGLPAPKNQAERLESLRAINTRIEAAEAEAARANLKASRLREESVQLLLGECTIKAPRAGVVGQRNFEEGEEIQKNTPLFVFFDMARVHVVVSVGEKDHGRVARGQRARIRLDALGSNEYPAEVDLITPMFDLQSRSGEVRLLLPNPGDRLRPGMFAKAVIQTGRDVTAFRVPSSCVVTREKENPAVFVVSASTAFEKPVRLGKEKDNLVEILEGLAEGDALVVEGMETLRDGQSISLL